MEGLQKTFRDAVSQDPKASLSAISSFFEKSKHNSSASASSSSSSADHSQLLIARPPRQMISAWTCSKLCAFCFVAGIFFGYTLKKRVRRWASKLLKQIKKD